MNVMYWKELGRYDFASNKKDWCVTLHTPFGNVSEMWPADEEPETDDLLPSEVLTMIEARLKSWWISTGREERLAKIAAIREHKHEIDLAWLERVAASAEKRAAGFRAQMVEILDEMEADA